MSYDYQAERPRVFTESGQIMFLQIRDNAQRLVAEAGAVRCDAMQRGVGGDTWQMLACIDRLVEIGELREVTAPRSVAGQFRIFTNP